MIGWLILVCEAGFWLIVLGGLFIRYVLKQRKIGGMVLLCTPIIDLLLLIFTVIDLKNGAPATIFHALSAVYIGVTAGFGHSMIKWMDQRFSYWMADGPIPEKAPKFGSGHARAERIGWFRHFLSWMIGIALMYGMILYIGDSDSTEEIQKLIKWWSIALAIDFLYSFSYSLWPRRKRIDDKA
ncbi:hypothetical protein SAMN05443252_102159 [Bacillus sp. OV322]|uniref:hypothetical protein n=1 Tax=Bacillus sp. OV322 TaxID=1882764 RepID=UPI0008E19827|nr:hypothetical protein [Bacillus sp. OV322]SFC19870.1 hypothetical protein SAMN05443252_102159 [Bacillus sp. OV322]